MIMMIKNFQKNERKRRSKQCSQDGESSLEVNPPSEKMGRPATSGETRINRACIEHG